MKKIPSFLKPYLRWTILGGTLFFLAKVLKDNWQKIAVIPTDKAGWAALAIALLLTLLAHIWSGWVWSWILQELNQPFTGVWGVRVYLTTNFAKYLPGNVWHFYGRVKAVTAAGGSLSAASLSVVLEPLMMAAAGLLMALICTLPAIDLSALRVYQWLQFLALPAVLIAIHPWILNPLIRWLFQLKSKATDSTLEDANILQARRYPLRPLLGELGFIALRSGGFLLTWLALDWVNLSQIPLLLGAFSFAWMLGLITPGAPGGLGVLEATAIALLNPYFSPGMILSVVALNRLVSIVAEAIGAALAWLDERR